VVAALEVLDVAKKAVGFGRNWMIGPTTTSYSPSSAHSLEGERALVQADQRVVYGTLLRPRAARSRRAVPRAAR
jgi:hypothetical protein